MKKKGMRDLFKWAAPHIHLVLVVLFISIINPTLYSFVPQFIRYVVDFILKGSSEGSTTLPSFLIEFYKIFENQLTQILIVGITLVLYQAFRGLLMFMNGYFRGKVAENIAYDMRTKLFSHIQNLSYSYHNNVDTGDLIQRCTSDVETVKSFLSAQLPQLMFIIASIVSGAFQLYLINSKLMFVSIIVMPITLTASIIYFSYTKKKFEEIEEVEASMTSVLQENINGVRVVKAFANEPYEIEKFHKESYKFKRESQKLNNLIALYWGSSDFITVLQYVITLGVAITIVQSGAISEGDVIAALMYIGMLVWPVRGLGRIIGDFGKATVASSRIQEILDLEDDYVNDGHLTPEIKGNIEFKNVSFKFNDTNQEVLKDITFKIKAGETVAIVGKTGSGKSTVVNLLVRMLEVSNGNIFIDGVDIKDIKKSWIRENIGIILQDPFLYATTIYENIKIGLDDVNEEEVYEAAKIAAIHDDIMQFEEGYNTLVGEKGVTLSGGQKQRIAIARMLLLNKPVIIFDDSLSAVDTSTDLAIRRALGNNSLNLTSIIITHRITTAKEADKIIVLEDGVVAAVGTHDELSKQEGLYKQLWDIQGALEEEFLEFIKGEATHE
ncbi:MAG TPA: ABC transporter ATP-binding protein [Acholeplasmataceae bacterium]|nr:ABC transporter ATP-binding protein [Acholeplasmataceae bacterium]